VAATGVVPTSYSPNRACSLMPWDTNNWKDDLLQSWQFIIEREIMKDTLKLYCIGNHCSNLEQRFFVNPQEAQYSYPARTGQRIPGKAVLLRVNPNWRFDAENHTGRPGMSGVSPRTCRW
jgi:hypothetical protein